MLSFKNLEWRIESFLFNRFEFSKPSKDEKTAISSTC